MKSNAELLKIRKDVESSIEEIRAGHVDRFEMLLKCHATQASDLVDDCLGMALLADIGQIVVTLLLSGATAIWFGPLAYFVVALAVTVSCGMLMIDVDREWRTQARIALDHVVVGFIALIFGAIWPALPVILVWGAWRERHAAEDTEMREQLLAHRIVPETHLTREEVLILADLLRDQEFIGGSDSLASVRDKTVEAARRILADREHDGQVQS